MNEYPNLFEQKALAKNELDKAVSKRKFSESGA